FTQRFHFSRLNSINSTISNDSYTSMSSIYMRLIRFFGVALFSKKSNTKPVSALEEVAEDEILSEDFQLPKEDYEELGFRQDPFALDIDPTDPRNTPGISEFRELRKKIYAITRENMNMVVIGPSGIGKTLLARTMATAYDLGKVQRRTAYIDAISSEVNLYEKIYSSELILIDNAQPLWQQLNEYSLNEYDEAARVVAFLSYFDYRKLMEKAKSHGKARFSFLGSMSYHKSRIPRLNPINIVQMLNHRLIHSRNSAENGSSITPFSKEALNEIAHYSLGLPIMALQIASDTLSEFAANPRSSEKKEILAESVHEVVRSSPYSMALGIVESATSNKVIYQDQDARRQLSLRGPRKEVLITMAQSSQPQDNGRLGPFNIERSELKQYLSRSPSTISHHTMRLAEDGYFLINPKGNSVSYSFTSPIYRALELLSYEQ
ncbi:MAG: hypothetical protein ACFFB3_17540, partial [Candidatus Hodarchaeota archaeon]